MPLNVTLTFPSPGALPGLVVHRFALRDGLGELFEVVLLVTSTDLAAPMESVAGQAIVVAFGDEPLLPQIEGLVASFRQLTSILPSGAPASAALYELTVVPSLWLTTRRRDSRIFQKLTVPEIVDAVLAGYGGRIGKAAHRLQGAHPQREYCVQYDETDHDFIHRLLSEEKIASFFDHAAGSTFTLLDDTSFLASRLPAVIPFEATSALNAATPHVFNVLVAAQVETSAVTFRDYDHENPRLKLEATAALPVAARLPVEVGLEAYGYEVGQFRSTAGGQQRAGLALDALRATARTFTSEASFAVGAGTRMILSGHPRPEPGAGLLVVRVRAVVDDGAAFPGAPAAPSSSHVLEGIEQSVAFFPARRPRPRIHGSQTAFVIGSTPTGTVEVDPLGRVLLAFRWDRRDPTTGAPTRLVRVSQAWAGNNLGFVTLPRIGDEVVVSYLDGDPDQPLVIGRVHNTTVPTPLDLPDKEKTLARWRSRSFSPAGPGDGFNEILMDDALGAERLDLHAERDFKSDTGRNASTSVGVDSASAVGGNSTSKVAGAYTMQSGSTSLSTGAYVLSAETIVETARTSVAVTTPEHTLTAGTSATISAGSAIVLEVGGSGIVVESGSFGCSAGDLRFEIRSGAIEIKSTGYIALN